MNEPSKKIRIKDIAKLAGVSEGTVDRVLHNRGEVSDKSKDAVNRVLDELNYTPNLLARTLASKKHFSFVALMPEHKANDYWESVESGFTLAAKDFLHYNVSIQRAYYNQYDSTSFTVAAQQVIQSEPDAVFIAPVFRNEVMAFVKDLEDRSVPFSFFDSMVEELNFHTYYGQHSFQSGYIGAKLLLETLPKSGKLLVIRTRRKGEAVSNQTLNRYSGFMQYIKDGMGCCYELLNVELIDGDDKFNKSLLSEIFTCHAGINGAITFNSKVHRLAQYLVELKQTDVQLVGYDLLSENVNFLKQGVVSFLIAQRPDKQAYFTVRDMCRKLIFNEEVQRVNYVPIDILMKENIDYYTSFKE